ncbi:hypothetical protein V6N11_074896 [Hibiscus sabdariffa]|uniref:Uncharacterized protein n=1 Tax=Hibiscus sabdariffa TaxID=183260 RepID=A0ABR2R5B2_9ROSI
MVNTYTSSGATLCPYLCKKMTKEVSKSKPAAGFCSRCGGGASVADMKTRTRFCYVPFYWKSWKAIVCTFCGAIFRSYR